MLLIGVAGWVVASLLKGAARLLWTVTEVVLVDLQPISGIVLGGVVLLELAGVPIVSPLADALVAWAAAAAGDAWAWAVDGWTSFWAGILNWIEEVIADNLNPL